MRARADSTDSSHSIVEEGGIEEMMNRMFLDPSFTILTEVYSQLHPRLPADITARHTELFGEEGLTRDPLTLNSPIFDEHHIILEPICSHFLFHKLSALGYTLTSERLTTFQSEEDPDRAEAEESKDQESPHELFSRLTARLLPDTVRDQLLHETDPIVLLHILTHCKPDLLPL